MKTLLVSFLNRGQRAEDRDHVHIRLRIRIDGENERALDIGHGHTAFEKGDLQMCYEAEVDSAHSILHTSQIPICPLRPIININSGREKGSTWSSTNSCQFDLLLLSTKRHRYANRPTNTYQP
jgi:hypothetical protein